MRDENKKYFNIVSIHELLLEILSSDIVYH